MYSDNSTLARALFKHMEWRYHEVPWPFVTLSPVDLVAHFVKRINEASVSNIYYIIHVYI